MQENLLLATDFLHQYAPFTPFMLDFWKQFKPECLAKTPEDCLDKYAEFFKESDVKMEDQQRPRVNENLLYHFKIIDLFKYAWSRKYYEDESVNYEVSEIFFNLRNPPYRELFFQLDKDEFDKATKKDKEDVEKDGKPDSSGSSVEMVSCFHLFSLEFFSNFVS